MDSAGWPVCVAGCGAGCGTGAGQARGRRGAGQSPRLFQCRKLANPLLADLCGRDTVNLVGNRLEAAGIFKKGRKMAHLRKACCATEWRGCFIPFATEMRCKRFQKRAVSPVFLRPAHHPARRAFTTQRGALLPPSAARFYRPARRAFTTGVPKLRSGRTGALRGRFSRQKGAAPGLPSRRSRRCV